MLSSSSVLSRLHKLGDTVLECEVFIGRGIHEESNQRVLQYSCALLNSGGGILRMKNVQSSGKVQSKDLDTWWSGMENNLALILSRDDLCSYVDFVGNYDDPDLFLFVKSADHLCTINYHCRLPTDTATHEVTHQSMVKLLTKSGQPGNLADLPPIPRRYWYGQVEDTLKQEGKQIQFKYLSSTKDSSKSVSEKLKFYVSKYVSAFGNHEGGHIYFGIEDETAAVFGEILSEEEEERAAQKIERRMETFIWGRSSTVARRGVYWDIQFLPVQNAPRLERRMVVVVSVVKFPGGVFTACPESYCVDSSSKVQQLSFEEWRENVLQAVKDKPELHKRFVKVAMHTPMSRLVFSLPHSLLAIREKVIKLTPGFNLQPRHVLDTVTRVDLKSAVRAVMSTFAEEPHLALAVPCWGMPVATGPRPSGVLLDVLLVSTHYGLNLLTFTDGLLSGQELWRHCRQVASAVKRILVRQGGCAERLGITLHSINVKDQLLLPNFQVSLEAVAFPPTFSLDAGKLDGILTALALAMGTYLPHEAESKKEEYFFLLTCDQFELLCTQQYTRSLWVHGPPGSGKTVAALQVIQELRRRGCQAGHVLYVAENELLCAYVRSFGLCQVVNRRELMADFQGDNPAQENYRQVRNVIVDEAQNFKDRDGDWYGVLERLSCQHAQSGRPDQSGYFWVFMDYAQKVHKFKAGLPSQIGKNNFMLSEISRNSKEIFEYASKFMQASQKAPSAAEPVGEEVLKTARSSPHLAHDYSSGQGVEIVKCDRNQVMKALREVLMRLEVEGVSQDDTAILLGKRNQVSQVQSELSSTFTRSLSRSKSREEEKMQTGDAQAAAEAEEKMEEDGGESESGPVVDTVRRFSGLDKPYIIGLDPNINRDHADIDKFIVNLATRAKDGLIIITSSDDLLQRLRL